METLPTDIRFGPWELRPASRELYKFGTKVKLRPQPFQVLDLLISHAGEVVTREQFRQQLWPSDTFVDFEHSLNTAIKELRAVLSDSATEPRYIETLPRLGYRFIFPIEPSAPEAHESAADSLEMITVRSELTVPEALPVLVPRSGTKRWVGLGLAAAVLLIVIVLAVSVLFRRTPGGTASASVKARTSIAVLGFRNMSQKPEENWMSTAMAEMLGAELSSGQQLRVIPGETVARMYLDLSLPHTDTYSRETLSKIRNHLGTDMIVSGSYLVLAEKATTKLRIILQVQDTRNGDTIGSFTEDGAGGDLPQLVSAAGDDLRRALGIGSLSATAAREVRASSPANSQAGRYYAEGLARLQGFDALAAKDLLEQAVASDPNHALSHSALAESLSILGYDLQARDEAKKALDLSSGLSREERLSIEGRYRELIHDRAAALEIYRTLHSFFPDSLDYGLRLARAQIAASRTADALATVATMRLLPGPEGKDARIDLTEAQAAERMGDMKRSQKAAAVGAARAQAQGSGLMLASTIDAEAWAWLNLGEPDKAIAADTRARELWLTAGDARNAAKALHGIGIDQRDKGDLVQSQQSIETALKEFRRIGANWDLASCLHNLGILFLEQGRIELSRERFEEALRIQSAQNDTRGVSWDLDGLGQLDFVAGQMTSAKQKKEQALAGFRQAGDRRGESVVLDHQAELLYHEGALANAADTFSRAMVLQKGIAYRTGLATSLFGMARVLIAKDRLEEALSLAQQAQAVRDQNKEEKHAADSDLQLAEIALAQGRPGSAESLARKAIVVFEKAEASAPASLAWSALARALSVAGKLPEARSAAERAVALTRQNGDRIAALEAGFALAEVGILSGKSAEAEHSLNALRDQARREGYAALELKSRLLLARAELQSGKRAAARTHFNELEADAKSKGFALIARQAKTAVAGIS